MPHSGLLPWILTSIVASVAGAVSGVHAGWPLLSWAAVLIFAVSLIATSLETNRPWWERGAGLRDHDAAATATLRNTRLMIFAYAWGGLVMFAVYRLSGLRWYHGGQYAAAMMTIALLLQVYVRRLARSDSQLREPRALLVAAQLAAVQALSVLAGLIFLLVSGKLASAKGDWAANQIFVGGGVAVMVLSAIATYTQYRLMRTGETSAGMAQAGGRRPL